MEGEEEEGRRVAAVPSPGVAMGGGGGEKTVLMWGYLPGVSSQRSPIFHPTPVCLPDAYSGDAWGGVSGGGCGFALAVSELGKLLTWGSTDYMGQSYLTSGQHEETPEAFPLPTEAPIVRAAAGWAHCVAITVHGEVYTWGWNECVPSGAVTDVSTAGNFHNEEKQVSQKLLASTSFNGPFSSDSRAREESPKRRKVSSKHGTESSISGDETLSALPCLVTFNTAVRISTVAAGGRHTLALSDIGQVWGWGYGGEGQLGLGSRTRLVYSPHPVPCIEAAAFSKNRSQSLAKANISSKGSYGMIGKCIKSITCGGRHSAVVTDTGAVLTFGWGLYGQCGHGSTDDELSARCVSSLLGVEMQGVAAGLWHTICTSSAGDVYAFGGNQFGQLGTCSEQAETVPKLVEATCLESKNAKEVSCGARHSALITDDGKVYCWGWNKYGQLGLGDSNDRNVPSEISITESYKPLNVSCGWWHTLVLVEAQQ